MSKNIQKDNVSNQREHLILLLANVHIRQLPKPEQQPVVCIQTQKHGHAMQLHNYTTLLAFY